MTWVEEAACTCQQHRPLDLEGEGEQGTKPHSVSCWHIYVGVWHSRIVLEGGDCLLPRPESKVPAEPMQQGHVSELPDVDSLQVASHFWYTLREMSCVFFLREGQTMFTMFVA